MPSDVVRAWVDEHMPTVTPDQAWFRAGVERAKYEGFAVSSLSFGHSDAARDWAHKAAECAKAEAILALVAKHYGPVKELVGKLEADERMREHLEVEKENRKARQRKHFAEQRALEKARNKS